MPPINYFDLGKIAFPIIVIPCAAWVSIEKSISDGAVFLIFAILFFAVYVIIEGQYRNYLYFHGLDNR